MKQTLACTGCSLMMVVDLPDNFRPESFLCGVCASPEQKQAWFAAGGGDAVRLLPVMIDPKKIIHGGPCIDCTAKLGRLEPHAAVLLDHEDCQAILTQGLRIIATHADHTFSIAGATVRPPWESINPTGYVACSCGSILQNREQLREHWQRGHLDKSR